MTDYHRLDDIDTNEPTWLEWCHTRFRPYNGRTEYGNGASVRERR